MTTAMKHFAEEVAKERGPGARLRRLRAEVARGALTVDEALGVLKVVSDLDRRLAEAVAKHESVYP